MASLTDTLNEAQARAVEVESGPLMILAGPGSGKTRVITHRIAHLVQERGVPPWRILAVTFTNKAAKEMRERVDALLGAGAASLSMGTFHSICARLLRREGEAIGLSRDFAIYDTDDQTALIRTIESELDIDQKRFTPRAVLSAISAAKNERRSAASFQRSVDNYFEEIVGRVYERYEAALRRNGAVDFDDLLGRTLELFEAHPEIQQQYAERYLHTLVDEFQDTNLVQYQLARALSSVHRNLTVVGDPDQSIYSWRAADIRNLLNFEEDFPGATVVLLEQNYRSTGHILRVAHSVIRRAEGRPEKNLWTSNPDGERVVEYEATYGEEEALFIAGEVNRLLRGDRYQTSDIAVMYRTNAQSRAIEEAFIAQGVKYRIVGGTRFYDRREVRDLIAYLRIVHNEYDTVAFDRIVNVPTRGIGEKSVNDLIAASAELGISVLAVAHRAAYGPLGDGVPELATRTR
ncbi:MAG: ATP-dependent helicase, partial [Dehalococcoidia bacterium]